jgi:hypothetical protein
LDAIKASSLAKTPSLPTKMVSMFGRLQRKKLIDFSLGKAYFEQVNFE